MLVLSRGAHASPAARVLDEVRRGGVVMRDDLVESTELSQATVARAVSTLVDAQLVRLRPDMVRAGATGRPSIPLQLDTRRHAVVGVHLGRVRTTVALSDVRGRVLESVDLTTPADLDGLADRLAAAVASMRGGGRLVVSAGLVGAWADLGLDREALGAELGEALGIDVSTSDHITAAAAAEHAVGAQGARGATAYVYARDTIGFAVAQESAIGTVISRSSRLTHFPIGSETPCPCRAVGCLEATASDRAIAVRALADGVVEVADVAALHEAARSGSARARTVLHDRAVALGRAAAFVRDMVGCDRIVLVGQGFAHVRDAVVEGFDQATTLPPLAVDFGHYGDDLQAVAAGTIALVRFAEDPLAHLASARTADARVTFADARVARTDARVAREMPRTYVARQAT